MTKWEKQGRNNVARRPRTQTMLSSPEVRSFFIYTFTGSLSEAASCLDQALDRPLVNFVLFDFSYRLYFADVDS